MTFYTWFLFFVTETALSLVPGPAVLFVLGTALRHGLRTSIGATLGVLSANTIYFIASALGLGLVIANAQGLFTALKWAGAAYLVWLAIASFRAAARPAAPAQGDDGKAAAARSFGKAYVMALLLQLSNPKAILFFTALVPQFVHPESTLSVAMQITILGVTSVVSEFFVLLGYGALAARAARLSKSASTLAWFERASGVCLLGCAALVLAS